MTRKYQYVLILIHVYILINLTHATCLNKIIGSITQGNQINLIIDKPKDYNVKNFTHFSTDSHQLENFLTKLDFKFSTYIIFVNDTENLNDTLATIVASETFSTHAQLSVLTKNPKHIQEIARILWQYKLIRSFIIVHQVILSVFKIKLLRCEEAEVEKIMLNLQEEVCEFQDVKMDLKEIMRGCPIYTITGVQPPFINPENSTLKGVLLEMMDAFGEASDRIIIYRPYDPIYMDEIVESYTFESMIESFQSGYADLFIGAVQLSAMSVIDIGPLIIANDLLIVAPRELVRDMTEFINQPQKLHVFGRWTTGVLLIVISFKFLIRWSADKNLFPSFVQIFFMVFRTILNVPTACRIPKNTLVRIFLISILFYCMGFSSYLQGTLISIMNGPTYEPPVSDLKGLLDKGTPIVLNAGMAIFFQYMDLPYFQNVYDKHIPMLEKDLFDNVNVLLVNRNFATVIYKGYLIMKPNLEKSFSIFDLWPNAHVPAMPKNYFMHREFCYWFDQMVEFGIIQKFWRLYEFYYAKESVSAMSRMYQVRLEQFLPVLILWASGCCLAIFCFIFEVIVHYLHRIILLRK